MKNNIGQENANVNEGSPSEGDPMEMEADGTSPQPPIQHGTVVIIPNIQCAKEMRIAELDWMRC